MVDSKMEISHIQKNGWEQGSLLTIPHNNLIDKNKIPLRENTRYILISQNCDIIRDAGKEPYLEFIPITILGKTNGSFEGGKNPRILHLDAGNISLECIAYERVYISKNDLEKIKPDQDAAIADGNLDILISWLCNRYARKAFPDEFNIRLGKNKTREKLIRLLDNYGKFICGIYIKLTPFNEIESPTDDYKLTLLFLVDPDHYKDADSMVKVDECFEATINWINKVKGIEVIVSESKVKSLDDISLYDFMQYYKWDFDFISHSGEDQGETLPGTNQIK